MSGKKHKRTTYRTEFVSLSPSQQQHNLNLLRLLLALLGILTTPGEDINQQPLRPGRVPGRDRPQ